MRPSVFIALLLLAAVVAPVAADDQPPWPVGTLVLDRSVDFPGQLDCGPPDAAEVDHYLGIRLDFADVGRADLDGVEGMTGWTAEFVLQGIEIVEVELLPPGATDADPDPARFDVSLATPLLASDQVQALARIRVRSDDWAASALRLAGRLPGEERPHWSSVGSTEDCPAPCVRPVKGTSFVMALLEQGRLAGCVPDVCYEELERPRGGETWIAGETERLLYSLLAGQYRIEFSDDGGETWQIVKQDYATQDWFDWTVPDLATDGAMLRLCTSCIGSPCTDPVVFSIDREVSAVESSWSAVKARY